MDSLENISCSSRCSGTGKIIGISLLIALVVSAGFWFAEDFLPEASEAVPTQEIMEVRDLDERVSLIEEVLLDEIWLYDLKNKIGAKGVELVEATQTIYRLEAPKYNVGFDIPVAMTSEAEGFTVRENVSEYGDSLALNFLGDNEYVWMAIQDYSAEKEAWDKEINVNMQGKVDQGICAIRNYAEGATTFFCDRGDNVGAFMYHFVADSNDGLWQFVIADETSGAKHMLEHMEGVKQLLQSIRAL